MDNVGSKIIENEPGSAKNKIARVVSDVLSPPSVFAIMGFSFAWIGTQSFWTGLLWGAIYGFFVSLVPLLVVIFMYMRGQIDDIHIHSREQRRIPYLSGVIGAGITCLIVYLFNGPWPMLPLSIGTLIGLGFLGLVNQVWLISNHAASISMAVSFVGMIYGAWVVIILAPLIVLVVYARWVLRRHTWSQLAAGVIAGVGTVLLVSKLGLF